MAAQSMVRERAQTDCAGEGRRSAFLLEDVTEAITKLPGPKPASHASPPRRDYQTFDYTRDGKTWVCNLRNYHIMQYKGWQIPINFRLD